MRLAPGAIAAVVTSAWASAGERWATALWVWAIAGLCAALWWTLTRLRAQAIAARRARALATGTLLACLIPAAVAASGCLQGRWGTPHELDAALDAGARVTVAGIVTSEAEPLPEDPFTHQARTGFDVTITEYCLDDCASHGRAHAVIRIVTAEAPPRLGDRLAATGPLSASATPGVAARMFDPDLTSLGRDPTWARVDAVRGKARDLAEPLDPQIRGLVLGMVTGDTRDVPRALAGDMQRTGLTHLTAVSGSHFAIVTLVIGSLLKRSVRSRKARALALASAMVWLTAIVLAEPSVVRALTMALAVCLGWLWGRPARALSALAAGATVLLIVEPSLGAALGFQLSVVAVVAIVLWSPRIARILTRYLVPWLSKALAVPLAAWLACWPLLVGLNDSCGLYTVPANLIAGVSAGPVTVVGLAALAVSWLSPAAASVLMQVAGASAWPVVWSAQGFAKAPGAWIAWPPGPVGLLLAISVSLAVGLATFPAAVRDGFRLALALVAVALAGASPYWSVERGPVTDDWAFVVCDVGQGSMLMARVDQTSAVVVDTGPPGQAGAECLSRYGVERIALLVITHPHADHEGALEQLAQVASIGPLWVATSSLPDPVDSDSLMNSPAARLALGAGLDVASPGEGAVWSQGEATVTVLLAPTAHGAVSDAEVNDTSLALSITSGSVSALVNGDAQIQAQDALARKLGGPIVVDLVVVAHHGSAIQSHKLAALTTARVAAVSVGASNPYGHPAAETLDLYSQRAIEVLTTATCSDIAISVDRTLHARCP